jgi:acetoin utilization deacetylase AcuC-like enzyme
MKVFYSPAYVASDYAFETTRKAAWVADSLRSSRVDNVVLVEPAPVSETDLCTVHDPAYISAVKSGTPRDMAESQGFPWNANLWEAVCSSTGGAIAAAQAALVDGVAGSLSSGLHHAKRGRGDGFCTFNGLALAAHAAVASGVRHVLILDFDAHCGGGTYALIADVPGIRQGDIAVSTFDRYLPTGHHQLEIVEDASQYLPAVRRMLDAVGSPEGPQLCLYNAGMDPHENCPVGGLAGITEVILAERERLVFDWCRENGCPLAFVLAGGYAGGALSRADLVALHRITIGRAAQTSLER